MQIRYSWVRIPSRPVENPGNPPDDIKKATVRCVGVRQDAKRLVARYVEHYNTVRLHGAIGYVTLADKREGREPTIHAERDRKLNEARERRRAMRQATRATAVA